MRALAKLLLPRLLRSVAPRLADELADAAEDVVVLIVRAGRPANQDDLRADVEQLRSLLRK